MGQWAMLDSANQNAGHLDVIGIERLARNFIDSVDSGNTAVKYAIFLHSHSEQPLE